MSNIDDNIRKAAEEEVAQIDNIFAATHAKELETACKGMFDLYKNYVNAGFTPEQALRLLIATIQMPNAGKGNGK